jgi:hypothetical protein
MTGHIPPIESMDLIVIAKGQGQILPGVKSLRKAMPEENSAFRILIVHHHSSERDVLVDLDETDIRLLF